MTETPTNRIEEALAHQEQQIADLNDVVIRQGHEIDRLKKHVSRLQDKVEVIEDAAESDGGEGLSVSEIAARDKPPHY